MKRLLCVVIILLVTTSTGCLSMLINSAVSDKLSESSDTTQLTTAETFSQKSLELACRAVPYKTLARTPDDYIDEQLKFNGTVVQVVENQFTEMIVLLINENDDYDRTWYVSYWKPDGAPRILENDSVRVFGVFVGLESYTTVLGLYETIPHLNTEYVYLK